MVVVVVAPAERARQKAPEINTCTMAGRYFPQPSSSRDYYLLEQTLKRNGAAWRSCRDQSSDSPSRYKHTEAKKRMLHRIEKRRGELKINKPHNKKTEDMRHENRDGKIEKKRGGMKRRAERQEVKAKWGGEGRGHKEKQRGGERERAREKET